MAVYVDDVEHPYGRMVMCHLWADSEEELHAFADRLGLKRTWHQRPPKASWSHYDVSKGKKAQAIRLGAVLTDQYGPVEHEARQRGDTETLEMVTRARQRRAASAEQPTLDL